MSADAIKKRVGHYAVDQYVSDNMIVGLGTGSTARFVVERLAARLESGDLKNIQCVATSEETSALASQLGIPLVALDAVDVNKGLDVAIDGADEVDRYNSLIKGRGGALLREKLVALSAKTFVVVVDESKIHPEGLGTSGAFPVEVVPFGIQHTKNRICSLPFWNEPITAKIRTRPSASGGCEEDPVPVVTDNGNHIIDLYLKTAMKSPALVSESLIRIPGVVEHGLFLGMTSVVIAGYKDGSVKAVQSSPDHQTPVW